MTDVDLLLFRVGPSRYAADASQIRRVQSGGFRAELVDALGTPDSGARALVFATPDGERQICVDEVLGVRAASALDLRRLPVAAGSPPGVLGVWLEPGQQSPVVLVDLPTLVEVPGAPIDAV